MRNDDDVRTNKEIAHACKKRLDVLMQSPGPRLAVVSATYEYVRQSRVLAGTADPNRYRGLEQLTRTYEEGSSDLTVLAKAHRVYEANEDPALKALLKASKFPKALREAIRADLNKLVEERLEVVRPIAVDLTILYVSQLILSNFIVLIAGLVAVSALMKDRTPAPLQGAANRAVTPVIANANEGTLFDKETVMVASSLLVMPVLSLLVGTLAPSVCFFLTVMAVDLSYAFFKFYSGETVPVTLQVLSMTERLAQENVKQAIASADVHFWETGSKVARKVSTLR